MAEIQTADVLNVVVFLATGSAAKDVSSSDEDEEADDDDEDEDEEEDDEDEVLPGDNGAVSSIESSVISIGLSRDMLDRKLEYQSYY